MAMAPSRLFLLPLLLLLLQQQHQRATAAVARSNVLHPRCQESCGNFSVPYPFGIGPDCYRDEMFMITCKINEYNGALMPYWVDVNSTLPVYNFSVSQGQATMLMPLSYACYNATDLIDRQTSWLSLSSTPFTVSASRNKFTAIGCNTVGYISAGTTRPSVSGCVSFCRNYSLDSNFTGSCMGTGCCQSSIPSNLVYYKSLFLKRQDNDSTWKFNPCRYSFVSDGDHFKFDESDLKGEVFKLKYRQGIPMILDWVAGNTTCEEARKNITSYACRSSNSICQDSPQGLGYT